MNEKSSLVKLLKLGQPKTNEHTVMAILVVIVGLAGGLGAVGFRYLINFFQTLAYGSPSELLEVVKTLPWGYKVGIPAAGGLLVGPLEYFFAREAKGHGVPEVMESVALRGGVIRKRVVLVKTLASAISIGSGIPLAVKARLFKSVPPSDRPLVRHCMCRQIECEPW